MNYIKVGSTFINLDAVTRIWTNTENVTVVTVVYRGFTAFSEHDRMYEVPDTEAIDAECRDALRAWLSVPAHMAGVIAADDRDVMAWWQRQQAAKVTHSEWKPGVKFTRNDLPDFVYTVTEVIEPVIGEHGLCVVCVRDGVALDFTFEVTEGFKVITDVPTAN